MALLEILTFRLAADADQAAFLAADKRVQTEFAYHQPGLVRRTAARHGTDWVVIDLWQDVESADACDARWGKDPLTREYMTFVERGSVRASRYETLD